MPRLLTRNDKKWGAGSENGSEREWNRLPGWPTQILVGLERHSCFGQGQVPANPLINGKGKIHDHTSSGFTVQ